MPWSYQSFATRDVEFAGVQIKKGDNVTCSTILASRDPRDLKPQPGDFHAQPQPAQRISSVRIVAWAHTGAREIIVGIRGVAAVIRRFESSRVRRSRPRGGVSSRVTALVW